MGAATIAQVKLFNNHPTGKVFKEDRLRALAGDGGIQECGFAQNCVEACPKQLPLTKPSPTSAATCCCKRPKTGCVNREPLARFKGKGKKRQGTTLVVPETH